jgi:hypothetical protein
MRSRRARPVRRAGGFHRTAGDLRHAPKAGKWMLRSGVSHGPQIGGKLPLRARHGRPSGL